MIEVVEDDGHTPICPHCESELVRVFARRMKSPLGVRYLYSCWQCRKVLGVSQRKGFWMG